MSERWLVIDSNHTLAETAFAHGDAGAPAARTIERLRSEHGNVARVLRVLETHLTGLYFGEEADNQLMLDVVSYLIYFVDQSHHAREDHVVERISEREPLARAMAATLASQHEEIASQGQALSDGLARAVVDEPVGRQELVRLGFAYAAALRRNMEFEERVVFPLALLALDPAEWGAIEDAAEAAADPLFGGAVDERYRDLLDELAGRAGCECCYAATTMA
jgi:hemerythrin-like domain-containing protein